MDFEDVRLSDGRIYKLERVEVDTRTAIASVKGDRIVIKIPRMLRGSDASGMFQNLKGRIIKSLEQHPERYERRDPRFIDGQVVKLLGKEYGVSIAESGSSRSYSKMEKRMLLLWITNQASGDQRDAIIYRLAVKTLSKSLLHELTDRINAVNASSFGSGLDNVRIRDNSSRWGSYSRRARSITINFRLLYAPIEILDYVIYHELAHTIVPNHSARFWSIVEKRLPDYKGRRAWLRKNGDLLGRTGRLAS